MPDELREIYERLTRLEEQVKNINDRLKQGIATWQFLLLLAASVANAAAHWLKH